MGRALPDGYRRRAFEALASTSGEAMTAARRGEPGGLWVTAVVQTAGRGRRGRAWSTEPGNLAASLLLIDPAPPALAPTLSFVAAVALHRAIVDLAGPGAADRLTLKWPNDLLLDGSKVSGILVEGENFAPSRMAVVLGIGVNCVSHPEITAGLAATDLRAAGLAIPAEDLFPALAVRMAEEVAVWNRGEGFAATRAAWLARAAGVGQTIRVNLADRSVEGRFDALDEAGRLILARPDGHREAFSAGDVFLAAARVAS
jgi:BirA family biotin operon repressor/biotin-[acetyl-CoA-carboxylase] ligase